MNVTIAIYQVKIHSELHWITLGLGPHNIRRSGRSAMKLQQSLTDRLKRVMEKLDPIEMERFQFPRGMRLEHVRLSLSLRNENRRRKISGVYPLIIAPRWANDEQRLHIAYHPLHQEDWFPYDPDEPIEEQATRAFQRTWADLSDEELEDLKRGHKDQLRTIAFIAHTRSLLDKLPDKQKGLWDDLKADNIKSDKRPNRQKGLQVLPKLGTNLSAQAAEESLPLGIPREPWRARLQRALCGENKRSALVVGPPGCGKSTLLYRLVADLLDADGYKTHRNLDRAWAVWRLSGRRIIAGMKYLGDWEKRCVEILADARRRKVILWIEDLHAFGQLGRTRDSDRNLANFFRGPIARGELIMIGECSPSQLQRLEDDAPSLASLFLNIQVPATSHAETLRMMIAESRDLEAAHKILIGPMALRAVLQMTDELLSGQAFPGKALDTLRRLAREAEARHKGERPPPDTWLDPDTGIGPKEVVSLLSERTGLPEILLETNKALPVESLRSRFTARVMGQPQAVGAVCDLILRIRGNLTDPGRPYGVFLFTGPTGTGKTELARALASYLYSDPRRLLRLDMSEYNHPGAGARLIGDRYQPEGLLTRHVRDQPFCVVLFDEIEKAHPSVLGLLLQLFDEGRLTDAAGHTADFTHTVVVMTSNLGARTSDPVGFAQNADEVLLDVARAVKDFFPPELFNRIDQVVPFGPLNTETAAQIAHKELGRLLARRGLTERHIFVYANDAVIGRIVNQGFTPQDGARGLKRALDTQVGTLLATHITQQRRASMQVLRLYEHDGQLKLHAEPLEEAEPIDTEWLLEALLDAPLRELLEHIKTASEDLAIIEESEALAQLSDAIRHHLKEHNLGRSGHADQLFNLDSMRLEVQQFRERIDELLRGITDEEDEDLLEFIHVGRVEPPHPPWAGRTRKRRIFDPRAMARSSQRLVRSTLLASLAEVRFLQRALTLVHQPDQHAIFIELLRIGHSGVPTSISADRREPGLMEALIDAYIDHHGDLESCAGHTHTLGSDLFRSTSSADLCLARPEHAVLKLVGLCVHDIYAPETGTHILQTLAAGPDIVRVRILPAPADMHPAELIEAHNLASTRFQHAIETGADPLPENPFRLLPALRRLKAEPTRRGGSDMMVEIEDFLMTHTATLRVRSLGDAMRRVWLLRQGGS